VTGLNRVKKIAEDNNVMICLELLNSKVDHHDYQCDHTAWGVEVIKRVDSPKVKLLYDIYHMQIMEGDVIRTIRQNFQYLAHFHTGGVPGATRSKHQELNHARWQGAGRSRISGLHGARVRARRERSHPVARRRRTALRRVKET
jgi:hydroxypyruvate isomerase